MKLLKYKCSYYSHPFEHRAVSSTVNLVRVLKSFSNDSFKDRILYARTLYNNKDQNYGQYKHTLPAVAFSGLFHPTRAAANITYYNGMIVLDLDKVGDRLLEIKAFLLKDPYVIGVWLSPSGDGLKFLIHTTKQKEDHKRIYQSALNYFDTKYTIRGYSGAY